MEICLESSSKLLVHCISMKPLINCLMKVVTMKRWLMGGELEKYFICCFFVDNINDIHLFSFFVCCCSIMCLYVLSSVLWFPHKNDVWFVFTSSCLQEGSFLIYVIYICLLITVSNTYCLVFFFVLCTLSCKFLWIVHF